MPINTITSGITAITQIKSMFDAIRDGDHKIELQSLQLNVNDELLKISNTLMTMQAENQQLFQQNNELKEEMAKAQNWENEKQNYELHRISRDAFTYRLKENAQNQETLHDLCASCFQNGYKSILQFSGIVRGPARQLTCYKCNSLVICGISSKR